VGAAEAAHDTANVEGIAVRLGDPLYFVTIVGIWIDPRALQPAT
jgi:hypothetical protein